jgi:prevent-host-death family protein
MRSVHVAELKNRLSRYLAEVREGEELIVCDRKTPVAKVVPLGTLGDLDADELTLVAAGLLRPPEVRLPASFWSMPLPRVRGNRAVDALIADREGE